MKLFQGSWGASDCVWCRFSPVPDFKASFVSSDGESPPPPPTALNLAAAQAVSISESQLRMSE